MSDSSGELDRADQAVSIEPPPPFRRPVFDPEGGPPLDGDNLDSFIEWAAAVPVAGIEVVRRRIAAAREDRSVFMGLVDRLWQLPTVDVSRHCLLLSVVGELRNPEAVRVLSKFVWYSDEMTVSRPEAALRDCTFEANGTSRLRARAAEMLAWLSTEQAYESTLQIAVEHPDGFVRAAAVDAYMYNHDDSAAAAEYLRKIVRPADQPLVGLPRWTRDTDPEEFERRVLDFYDRYPEERPRDVDIPVPAEPTHLPSNDEVS